MVVLKKSDRPESTGLVRRTPPVLVRHRPHPALAGLVAGIIGMEESSPVPVERRQPAGSLVPLVVGYGDPLEIREVSAGEGTGVRRSFVAGLMPGHTATSFIGRMSCVQVYLTPLGAGRLLGVPGRDLAGQIVDVAAVAPALGDAFADRLASCATWADRFGLVDAELLRLLDAAPDTDPLTRWMWQEIRSTSGRAAISGLVARSGWSHRHVTATFRRHTGLTPKGLAAIVRFEHAVAALAYDSPAEVALRHGYADQSHLTREAVRLAGATPAILAARRPPTAYTALGIRPG